MARALLPAYVTPRELAEHLGVSERSLREMARELGACRIIGKVMVHLEEDVATLMEATRPCQSQSTAAAKSTTTGAPLPAGDYEALRARRTSDSRKGSRRKPKLASGDVISMGRGRT